MGFHDSELLEGLQLVSFADILLLTLNMSLFAPLKPAKCSSWSLFLYEIYFISICDLFVLGCDLEVISDQSHGRFRWKVSHYRLTTELASSFPSSISSLPRLLKLLRLLGLLLLTKLLLLIGLLKLMWLLLLVRLLIQMRLL